MILDGLTCVLAPVIAIGLTGLLLVVLERDYGEDDE